jgi:hypothetical protein
LTPAREKASAQRPNSCPSLSAVGLVTNLTCRNRDCLYMTTLTFGQGRYAERGLRRCARCGGMTDVLVREDDPPGSGWTSTSGRGRCRDCGSQALREASVSELRIGKCPRCGAGLEQTDFAIWD